MSEQMAPVTGIARGGLGTATNLDDTQRYAVEELVIDDPAPTMVHVQAPTGVVAPARPRRSAAPRSSDGTARMVAVAAFAILVLAAALTLRDASGAGPGTLGGNDGGALSLFPTSAPAATAAPKPTSGGAAGKGNGHGHGNGNGHGH